MLNQVLDNTLYSWRTNFIKAKHNVEKAWDMTKSELASKRIEGFENFDEFTDCLKDNKGEALKKYSVIGGLNILINDDVTVKKNIELVKSMGYILDNPHADYTKTLSNGSVVEATDYMLNTHTTEFLKKVLLSLEDEVS